MLDPSKTRAVNRSIAAGYDAVPYDPSSQAFLDPEFLFGIGALYGCAAKSRENSDVLDLGCGGGVLLERVAARTRGRVVGVDISPAACERARARLGRRARIICDDALDVSARDLGQFDIIYNLGVLFIVPPTVRARLLEIIGACLRPQGVAVVSYYAGQFARMSEQVNAALRASTDPQDPPPVRIAAARARLAALTNDFPEGGDERRWMMFALEHAKAADDVIFFHEALNHEFHALETPQINGELKTLGASFLTYVDRPFLTGRNSERRTAAAAEFDRHSGGYRYAVFGRPSVEQGPDPRTKLVTWSTTLVRAGFGKMYAGPCDYHEPTTGRALTIERVETQAALDELAHSPRNFEQASSAARRRLAAAGVARGKEVSAEPAADFISLWNEGFLTPSAGGR